MTENVVLERDKFLEALKQKISLAYANRAKEELIDEDFLKTDVSQSRQQSTKEDLRKFKANQWVELGEPQDRISVVTVENSHDYPDLLRLGFKKLQEEGHIEPWERDLVNEDIQEALAHEYQHMQPALGQPGLKVRYGMEFFEDNTGMVALRPMISLSGRARLKIIRAMFAAPTHKSEADKIHIP